MPNMYEPVGLKATIEFPVADLDIHIEKYLNDCILRTNEQVVVHTVEVRRDDNKEILVINLQRKWS